jgi:hypothetical protein
MISERDDSDTEPTATLTNPGENAVGSRRTTFSFAEPTDDPLVTKEPPHASDGE